MKNIQNILIILICLTFSNNLFPTYIYNNDNYISKFANRYDDDCVRYEKEEDQLIIFSEPSTILTLLGTGAGIAGLLSSIGGLFEKEWTTKLIFIGFGIGSLYLIKKTIDYASQNIPYICFDKSGCHLWDEKIFYWTDIDKIRTETFDYYKQFYFNGSITQSYDYSRRYLIFYDEYKTELLKIASNDSHLPITLDNLSTLAEHYWKKYKS